jgi:putative membrane protein PagO
MEPPAPRQASLAGLPRAAAAVRPLADVVAGTVAVGEAQAVAAEDVVRLKLWAAFAALCIVWGTTWVPARTLAETVPPLRGTVARFALAGLVCIPIILWKRLELPRGRQLGCVFLLSFTLVALPVLLLLWAQPRLSSATVTVLFGAMPLLLVILDPKIVPHSALQSCIVALGAIAVVVSLRFSLDQAGSAAVVLLAVTSTAGSLLLVRRELRRIHPVVITALLLGPAALLLFLFSLLIERGQTVEWNRSAITSVMFLAVVGGAPAYATYFWLLERLEPYQVATLQWLEPLIALWESAILLHAGMSFPMFAGSLVTLLCLIWVMRARVEDDNPVSLQGNS